MSENNDQINVGTLLLVDAMNKARVETTTLGTTFKSAMQPISMVYSTNSMLQTGFNTLSALMIELGQSFTNFNLDEANKALDTFRVESSELLEEQTKILFQQRKEAKEAQETMVHKNATTFKEMWHDFKDNAKFAKENGISAWEFIKLNQKKSTKDGLSVMWNGMKKFGADVWNGITSGFKTIGFRLGAMLASPLMSLVNNLFRPFEGLFELMGEFFEPVGDALELSLAPLEQSIGTGNAMMAETMMGMVSPMNALTTAISNIKWDLVMEDMIVVLTNLANGFTALTGGFNVAGASDWDNFWTNAAHFFNPKLNSDAGFTGLGQWNAGTPPPDTKMNIYVQGAVVTERDLDTIMKRAVTIR